MHIVCLLNSSWPSKVTVWRQKSGSTFDQIMGCCLPAPSAFTWTNVDISSVKSCDNHLRAISQEKHETSITIVSLKITYLIYHSNLPGSTQFVIYRSGTMWWHRCWSSLDHIMILLLNSTKPFYLKKYWFIVNRILKDKRQRNFNLNLKLSFKKVHLKLLSAECQPFYSGINMLPGMCKKYYAVHDIRMVCMYSAVPLKRNQFSPKSSQKPPYILPMRIQRIMHRLCTLGGIFFYFVLLCSVVIDTGQVYPNPEGNILLLHGQSCDYASAHVPYLGRTLSNVCLPRSYGVESPCLMTTSWHANTVGITGPLWGESPVTAGFPSQRASNTEL